MFLGVVVFVWIVVLLLGWFGRRRGERWPFWSILFWAVAFRIIGMGSAPVYEDDYYRYLWDGYMFSQTGNPFGKPPLASFAAHDVPAGMQRVLSGVNNPDLPTIYGPTMQLAFLGSYEVDPGDLVALKGLLLLFEAASLFVFIAVWGLEGFGLLLATWVPLTVVEVAFNAHAEPVAIFFFLAALAAAVGSKTVRSGLALALAVAAKPLAWLAVPWLWTKENRRGLWSGVLLLGIAALYLPFVLQGSAAEWSGLRAMGAGWEFNSAIFAVAKLVFSPEAARIFCGVTFLLGAVWLFESWRRSGAGLLEAPMGLLFGWLLLCSPVINPWYLLWFWPFACRQRSVWLITFGAVVDISYLTGLNTGWPGLENYGHPVWLRPLEFGLIAMAAIVDWWIRRERDPSRQIPSRSGYSGS